MKPNYNSDPNNSIWKRSEHGHLHFAYITDSCLQLYEECGLHVESQDLRHRGILTFIWDDDATTASMPWEVHVFSASVFKGKPTRSDEMDPRWFLPREIPFDLMWADDRHW